MGKTKEMTVDVRNGLLATAVAAMLEATTKEGAAHDAAEAAKKAAAGSSWGALVKAFRPVLEKLGHGDAVTVLDSYKAEAMKVGGTVKARANNYASNLNRAVKAVKLEKTVPEALWQGSRDEWLNAEFWKTAGVLSNRGRTAGGTNANAGNGGGEGGGAQGNGQRVSEVLRNSGFKDAERLLSIMEQLHGPFRAEFLKLATAEAERILAKQAQSGSNGQPAVDEEEEEEGDKAPISQTG